MVATTNTKPRKIPSSACFNYILGKPPGGSYISTAVRPVKPTAARNKKPIIPSANVKKEQLNEIAGGGVCDLFADDLFSVDEVCGLPALVVRPRVLCWTPLIRLLQCS